MVAKSELTLPWPYGHLIEVAGLGSDDADGCTTDGRPETARAMRMFSACFSTGTTATSINNSRNNERTRRQPASKTASARNT